MKHSLLTALLCIFLRVSVAPPVQTLPVWVQDARGGELAPASEDTFHVFKTFGVQNASDATIFNIVNSTGAVDIRLTGCGAARPCAYIPGHLNMLACNYQSLTNPPPYYAISLICNDTEGLYAELMPSTGQLRPSGRLYMTFECYREGAYQVTWTVNIGGQGAVLHYLKYCNYPSCATRCVQGVCSNVTNLCNCLPGYTRQFCDLGVSADRKSVCAGQDFNLKWDVTTYKQLQRGDQIRIIEPNPFRVNASSDWTVAQVQSHLDSGAAKVWQWIYLQNNFDSYQPPALQRDILLTGVLPMRFTGKEPPGVYAIAYTDPAGKVQGVYSVTLLPNTDNRCMTFAGLSKTSNATNAFCQPGGSLTTLWQGNPSNITGYTCDCGPGYFGLRCQSGCAPTRLYLANTATNIYDAQKTYGNDMSCSWKIAPAIQTSVSPDGSTLHIAGIALDFSYFGSESNKDLLTIYAPDSTSPLPSYNASQP